MEVIGAMNKKKINWIKVVIAIILLILIIGLIVFFIIRNNTKNGNNPTNIILNNVHVFTDKTNSISLDVPPKYNLSEFNSDTDRVLELKSPDDLYVLVSYESLFTGEDKIVDFIYNDRELYLTYYEGVSNISEITEETVNNIKTYSYKFNYVKSNKNYTLETIWVTNDYGYYIIDINYLSAGENEIDKFRNIRSDVLNGFEFIKSEDVTTDEEVPDEASDSSIEN